MIRSFGSQATEDLFHGRNSRKARSLPASIRRVAVRKLDMINAAHELGDLRSPPGNRLEALRGDRRGYHSIRINQQWRVIFRWTDGAADSVEIIDYHE